MAQKESIDKRRRIEQVTHTNIQEIKSYLTSNIRQTLLKSLGNYTPEIVLSKNDYYKYRAVLIGEIIFRSAQRAGVVCGMRRSEVSAAEMVQECLKIAVFSHKTGKLKPAVVFLEKLASKAILQFQNNVLGQIDLRTKKGTEQFFVSFNGAPIKHAGVQTSLNTLLKLAGSKVKSITATGSRIATATFIATEKTTDSQIVADYMQHQPSTADKYYRQLGGGDHLISAFEAIGNIAKDK